MLYKVRYIHEVEITYDALVEASSEEEAREKMELMDFVSEDELELQGINIRIEGVSEVGEDDE